MYTLASFPRFERLEAPVAAEKVMGHDDIFEGRKNWLARISLDERKAEIVKVEEQSLDATGLRSDVIPLYAGGQYWLYRYTKYAYVRLVLAPENQIAFFGGDPTISRTHATTLN